MYWTDTTKRSSENRDPFNVLSSLLKTNCIKFSLIFLFFFIMAAVSNEHSKLTLYNLWLAPVVGVILAYVIHWISLFAPLKIELLDNSLVFVKGRGLRKLTVEGVTTLTIDNDRLHVALKTGESDSLSIPESIDHAELEHCIRGFLSP